MLQPAPKKRTKYSTHIQYSIWNSLPPTLFFPCFSSIMQACLKMSRKEPVFKISLELKRHYVILSLERRIPAMFCSPTLCDKFIGVCGCLMEALSILKMTQPNWNVYCIRHISNAHKLYLLTTLRPFTWQTSCVCAWSLYSIYFPSEVNSGAHLFPHPSMEVKNHPPFLGIGGQPYLGRNAELLVPKTPSIGLSHYNIIIFPAYVFKFL